MIQRLFFILLVLSTVWAFEYGGQKYSAKDDTDDSTESNDDLADAEDDDGPVTSASTSASADHTSLRNNIAKYVKTYNGTLSTKNKVPGVPRHKSPRMLALGIRSNSSLLEPDIDDSLKVLSLEAKKKSDVMASKAISEELLEPPVMNLPMRPLNYTTASLNVKQTIGEIGRVAGRNFNLTTQLEKESVESNSNAVSTASEGSGSGDVTGYNQSDVADTTTSESSGSGDGTMRKRGGLVGSNVGRMSKTYEDNEVVPVGAAEKEQLMSKFAAVDATGSGDASGSGEVTTTKKSKVKDSGEPTDDGNTSSGVASGGASINNNNNGANIKESVRRRRSKTPSRRTFTVYTSPEEPGSRPSYYTSNLLNVDNFGRSENTDVNEEADLVSPSKVVGDTEASGSGHDMSSGSMEGSGSGSTNHQRSKLQSNEGEDKEDANDEEGGEENEDDEDEDEDEEPNEENEEESKDEGKEEEDEDDSEDGKDEADDDNDDHDEDAVDKHQVRTPESGSGETATETQKTATPTSKTVGNKPVTARSVHPNIVHREPAPESGDSSGFSESGDFDATNGFSASGESEADYYGDIGPDYKAYYKGRNTATRRGLADRSPIVSYSYPRNDHVSYYKESPPDDIIGIPDTREMGSVKVPENQLNNVKSGEKTGEALAIVTATDDTAASGNNDVKAEIDSSSVGKKADKENSTKRDPSKTLSEALKDIAFSNKSEPGNRDAHGFHNETVHIYLDKDGKVHNTTTHKQFLDNHKDKSKKVKTSGKVSAMDSKEKKNSSHEVSLSKDVQLKKDGKEAELKKTAARKQPEEKKEEKAHTKDTQEKKVEESKPVDDNNEKSIANIEAELVDDAVTDINRKHVNESSAAREKSGKSSALNEDKSNDSGSDYIKDAITSGAENKEEGKEEHKEEVKQVKAENKEEAKEEHREGKDEKDEHKEEAKEAKEEAKEAKEGHKEEAKETKAEVKAAKEEHKEVDKEIKEATKEAKEEHKEEQKVGRKEEHKGLNREENNIEEEEKDKPIASGNVVRINVNNNNDEKEEDNKKADEKVMKSQLKNATMETHDDSIHLSIYPNGKVAVKSGGHGGGPANNGQRLKVVNSTLQKFEPHDSERAHIDIAKIKNEDGSTTEVEFYHNKSGLYESDKHYNDVDLIRNHSFYLSDNGTSLSNTSLYQYLHTNKWMMNETLRKNGPLSESSYAYLDQGEGSNKTSDEIIKKLTESKNAAAAKAAAAAAAAAAALIEEGNAKNSSSTDIEGMGNETSSNLNETELGQNLSSSLSLVEPTTVKEMIGDDVTKGNGTEVKEDEQGKQDYSSNNKNNNNNINNNSENFNSNNNNNNNNANFNSNNNNNNNNNNYNNNNNNNNKITDPYNAMIAAIGPSTTSLSGLGNFSTSAEDNGVQGIGDNNNNNNNNNNNLDNNSNNNNNNNSSNNNMDNNNNNNSNNNNMDNNNLNDKNISQIEDNNIKLDSSNLNNNGNNTTNSSNIVHNATANIDSAGINWNYDTQLALGDKLTDGSAAVSNVVDSATNTTSNGTSATGTEEDKKENDAVNSFQGGLEGESVASNNSVVEPEPEVKDETSEKNPEVKDDGKSDLKESEAENKTISIADFSHLNKNPGPNITDPMVELHKILSENDTNDNSRYAVSNDTDLSPNNDTGSSAKETEAANATTSSIEGAGIEGAGAASDATNTTTTSTLDSIIGQLNNTDTTVQLTEGQPSGGTQMNADTTAHVETTPISEHPPVAHDQHMETTTISEHPSHVHGTHVETNTISGNPSIAHDPHVEPTTTSEYPMIPHDPFSTLGTADHSYPTNASVIFNHMEPVNRTLETDIQYNQKPVELKNKEQATINAKNQGKKIKKKEKGVDVKVYSSGVTNVYVDQKGNVDVRRVDKKNETTTMDAKNRTIKGRPKNVTKLADKSIDGLDEDLMKEEPSHFKEEPKRAEKAKHEKETTKKESVKSDKETMELNLSSLEKAKISSGGSASEDIENDTNVYIDSKLYTKNITHIALSGVKNASQAARKPEYHIKTLGSIAKNKSTSLKSAGNKTTLNLKTKLDMSKKNESLSHHDQASSKLSHNLKNTNTTTGTKPKLKLMTKNMAAVAAKNKKNETTVTAKEKQSSMLFSKNSKDGSLLKAASKSSRNEKKKTTGATVNVTIAGGTRNISASDVSRSALTIVEDLVDIINSTHGKNKKNGTNSPVGAVNEKTTKQKITRYVKAGSTSHARLAAHPKRQTLLRHRPKKAKSRAYTPVSLVKRDAYETSQETTDGTTPPQQTEEENAVEESGAVEKRTDIPSPSPGNPPLVEEVTHRTEIPTPYGMPSSDQQSYMTQGYIIEQNSDPVTIEEVDPVRLESIRRSEVPDEYTADQQQPMASSDSTTVVKKSDIPEVVQPMIAKKGEIPADYLPEEIEAGGGMARDEILPEHVSAEAQHLQNIKKGEIASEYISEAVQPLQENGDVQARSTDPQAARKHTTRAHIPAKDRTRKVRMNELAAATTTTANGGNNVETSDENGQQYLEKRDKIWTDDLDDIEGVQRNIIEDNDDNDDTPTPQSLNSELRPQLRSNIMNMLSASENTMSSANSISSVPLPEGNKDADNQTSAGSSDERQEAESGSGENMAVGSGEDAGSAESTDENTPSVNTKRDNIARPYPITTDGDNTDIEDSETAEVSKRNDVEKEKSDKNDVSESGEGSSDINTSGSGSERGSGAADEVSSPFAPKNDGVREGEDNGNDSNGARESIVKKLVNEMAHAAAGSVKERSKGGQGSRDIIKIPDNNHVIVKKSDIEKKSGHEVVKRSSLSEEEIVNLSNNKDIHSALKMLVSTLITKGPGSGMLPNEHLLRVKRMESEEKLEKDLMARSSVPRNTTLPGKTKDRIVQGVRDLEGLGEELSQSDFLTPYKHDIIASKLEGDLLKNLKLDKEDSAIIYKEEDDLLKATEMEFIKDKIDREFGSNMGASREDKINAIKRTIKSLPLSKEDSDDLTKTIQAANWLGVDSTSTKTRKKKSKLKSRHKHKREH